MDTKGAAFLDEDGWYSIDVINESGVEVDHTSVIDHVRRSPEVAALSSWATNLQRSTNQASRRRGTITERDRYVSPAHVFGQFETARHASTEDDMVSGWLDTTEGLAFSRMSFECDDEQQGDIWNQIARDLDLDSRLREMWREFLTYSQCVVGTYWASKAYKIRGKTAGGKRSKKVATVKAPLGLTILDPMKIVPVGSLMFNQESLAYMADRNEADYITDVFAGKETDLIVTELFESEYKLTETDKKMLADYGCDRRGTGTYFKCKDDRVFRHTATRQQYLPFADLRLKSIFELLDLKAQLRQMDRVFLVASTNFIILIKKGTDQLPADQKEVNALAGYARTLARIPMLVGDHRLNVEIVTPSNDRTLDAERYNVLNASISARLYQIFSLGGFSAATRGDDTAKIMRMVARGLGSKRHQLRRSVERNVIRPIMDANPLVLDESPDLRFTPKRIALDFDANMAQFILDLAERGDLSRDTLLAEYDFDQDEEFVKRKRESAQGMDDVFKTRIPFSSPDSQPFQEEPPQSPKRAGRSQGGNRNGGGSRKAAPNRGVDKEDQ